jgi:NAD(P)-dependent dehydrogenase (short-subunit alcohol dehydrogenase family)
MATLDGRHIVITGAASGIGLATATLFAAQGARVALLDRNEEVMATARSIPNAAALVADVTDEASVNAAIAQAAEKLGAIDGLVNCAGVDFVGSILDTTPAEWRRVMSVNLTGPYLVCRAAVPWLRKASQATIVNVASGLGLRPLVNRTAYTSSKAGVIMFTKALALELAPNIRVNAVCPGLVDTPMVRNAVPDEAIEGILQLYAIKTFQTPAQLAQSILFLTSDASSHVTGIALAADGGRSFH